jgi:formate C-acetyltransferase
MQSVVLSHTPRIRKLLDSIQSSNPEIFPERALLVTASYQETEGLSTVMRRARLLEKVLTKMTIIVRDGELIVGCKTPQPLGSPLYPEIACDWIETEIDSIGSRKEAPFAAANETKEALRNVVFPYWKGKQVSDRLGERLPEEVRDTMSEGLFFHYYQNRSIGHITVDYETVLRHGLDSIKRKVQLRRQVLHGHDGEAAHQADFLQAMLIACEAVIGLSKRYADLARQLESRERDGVRKKELRQIAEMCDRVPEKPARTFREALQSFWFIHLALNLETNGYAIGPGRLDQYMYPFYKRDLNKGRITRDEAKELLKCLWIKFNELTVAKEGETAKASTSYNDFQNLNLAGVTPEGDSAENEISRLCLEVTGELRLPQPQVSVLVSKKTSDDFMLDACRVIRMGFGMPSIFNDEVKVLAILNKGKTLRDARLGGVNGCVELVVPGKEMMASSGYVNLVKCLELALNGGRNPVSGKIIGARTPDAHEFGSFDDIVKALRTQVVYAFRIKVSYDNVARRTYAEHCPVPLTSVLMHDCIEKMRDFHDGGAHYNQPMACVVGIGTVADSLAAIKRLVFEEKMVSVDELMRAMSANFSDAERLRQLLLNMAQKYGNDNEYADSLAVEVVAMICDVLHELKDAEGRSYAANLIPTTTHIYFGSLTGATPDGRRAGEPVSEGVSPTQGRDVKGPTAVFKSVSKLSHVRCSGTLLNMKMHPSTLQSEQDLKKFASLIRGYFALGGYHVQFNVVSAETLRDAQRHPENYQNLIIRVAGYSDYFVRLSKETQDEIISRTEHLA